MDLFSTDFITVIVIVFLSIRAIRNRFSKQDRTSLFYRKTNKSLKASDCDQESHTNDHLCFKPKPDWVKKEIIRLKALMPDSGCRKIANAFNRQHHCTNNMTVGKTYVANIIHAHRYQIQVLQKKLKHKLPKRVPRQLIWGVDLTFKTDSQKQTHAILGVIEHYSRKTLTLEALKDKTTISLLRYLFRAIEAYGKPKIVRTDNEAVFTSRLFSLTLWLLGISHQTIDKHCPWQNGRVERFFGTLKQALNRWPVMSLDQLNRDLQVFRFWYNRVRTHNNLHGKTPEEIWSDSTIHKRTSKNVFYFTEWDGLLTGFYHPH